MSSTATVVSDLHYRQRTYTTELASQGRTWPTWPPLLLILMGVKVTHSAALRPSNYTVSRTAIARGYHH